MSDQKTISESMKRILGEEDEVQPPEDTIARYLALAAYTLGVDLDDAQAVKEFIVSVKKTITKEQSSLKSLFRRFTVARAKAAAKGAMYAAQYASYEEKE